MALGLAGAPLVRPAWSPDGREIAVFQLTVEHMQVRLVVVDVETGTEVRTIDTNAGRVPQGLVWVQPSLLLIAQPALGTAPLQLWRLSYPDGTLTPVTNNLNNHLGLSLDRVHRRLATERFEVRGAVWIGDADGRTGTDVVPSVPVAGTRPPMLAWAGDRVIYEMHDNGRRVIVSVAAEARATVDFLWDGILPAGTSDGRTVVYNRDADLALFVGDTASRRMIRELHRGPAAWPILSRNDRDVYIVSLHGRQQLSTLPIDGGEPVLIVSESVGVNGNDASHDGRLLFSGPDGIVVCDLPACGDRTVVGRPAGYNGHPRWTPDGRIGYLCAQATNICATSLEDGSTEQLTQFTSERQIASFAWSHDGARLAIMRTTTSTDILLLTAR